MPFFKTARGQRWMGLLALLGAGAALFPGVSSNTASGAALLAVGALALLAGHAWADIVSAPAHIALAGRTLAEGSAVTIAIVVATALPALAFSFYLAHRFIRRFSRNRPATLTEAG